MDTVGAQELKADTTETSESDAIISKLSSAERAFYQECADMAGLSLGEWVLVMDEI